MANFLTVEDSLQLAAGSFKKGKTLVFVSFILLSLFLMSLTPIISFAKIITTNSECINCHANLSKLIRLSWEIEKIRPKPGKSAETSGEG